jgi:hypothetical protein
MKRNPIRLAVLLVAFSLLLCSCSLPSLSQLGIQPGSGSSSQQAVVVVTPTAVSLDQSADDVDQSLSSLASALQQLDNNGNAVGSSANDVDTSLNSLQATLAATNPESTPTGGSTDTDQQNLDQSLNSLIQGIQAEATP